MRPNLEGDNWSPCCITIRLSEYFHYPFNRSNSTLGEISIDQVEIQRTHQNEKFLKKMRIWLIHRWQGPFSNTNHAKGITKQIFEYTLITLDPIHQTMERQNIEGRDFHVSTPKHPKDKTARPTVKNFQNRSCSSNRLNPSGGFESYFGRGKSNLVRRYLSSYYPLRSVGDLFQTYRTALSLQSRMGIRWC